MKKLILIAALVAALFGVAAVVPSSAHAVAWGSAADIELGTNAVDPGGDGNRPPCNSYTSGWWWVVYYPPYAFHYECRWWWPWYSWQFVYWTWM